MGFASREALARTLPYRALRFVYRRTARPAWQELRRRLSSRPDPASFTASPSAIRLEAAPVCQLRCPSCPTASGDIRDSIVGKKLLALADFQQLVDGNPWIRTIELSNWGEIFLNPALLAITEYAHAKGVALTATNGTNFNNVKDEMLEALVKYRFRQITCAIDGASPETYVQYRIRGDFDRVIARIKRLNEFKRQYNSPYPALAWQFILFEHNKHEVEAAREMARELDMDFYLKASWDGELAAKIDATTPPALRQNVDELRESEPHLIKSICHQLWLEPQINSDGKILGCCVNCWGDFGNAFDAPDLAQALNNDRLVHARQMLTGMAPPKAGIPCTDCHHFRDLSSRLDWVTQSEIDRPAAKTQDGVLVSTVSVMLEEV